MADVRMYTVSEAENGERLDVVAAACAELTRSRAGTLIKDGLVLVNGAAQTKAGFKLRAGDAVAITLPEAEPSHVEAQDIPIDVLYQDDDLAVPGGSRRG